VVCFSVEADFGLGYSVSINCPVNKFEYVGSR
jgi:hypothetical protein